MPHKNRGRSYAEFNLPGMSVEQLVEHIKSCHMTELSCKANKSRRYWKKHKNEAQTELDTRLKEKHVNPN